MKRAAVIISVRNQYTRSLIQGISEQAHHHGWSVNVMTSHGRPDYELALAQRALDQRDSGLILLATGTPTPRQREYYERLLQKGYPLVLVGQDWGFREVCLIQHDHRRSVGQLVSWLMDLGHLRISLVSVTDSYLGEDEQAAAFFSLMQKHRNRDWERYQVRFDYIGVIEDEMDAREIRGKIRIAGPLRQVMGQEHGPTAFYCVDGFVAASLVLELAEMGLRPGQDVAVVSAGPPPDPDLRERLYGWAEHDCFKMGEVALESLYRMRQGHELDTVRVLVQGKSQGPFVDAAGTARLSAHRGE